MAKISVRVHLIYKNKSSIPSTYNVDWNSNTRDFESFMLDLMNTLVTLENDEVFDRVDVKSIDFINCNDLEKAEINAFKKANGIE